MQSINKGKVSVIMGIYNCEDTLDESIESILNQTYENWELIMCDDCSTDNTYNIAKKYADKYKDKIILIKNNENRKLAATLNHCLRYATGEYIARMDGDDISISNRFESQLKFLKDNNEYDLVGTAMIPFDENGDKGVRRAIEIPSKTTVFMAAPFAHATIMCNRKVYDKLQGYRISNRTIRCEDIDLWIRFFANNFKGYNIQEAYYKVRESRNDFKRRTLKTSISASKTLMYGVKELKLPFKYYILASKPTIAGLIPRNIIFKYHEIKLRG